ncbi:MAG: acyltransferase [Planctomycetaceae bacterium]|nr:acyltransferase [Planctomycetaceae bacterium]
MRRLCKQVLRWVCSLIVLPAVFLYRFEAALLGADRVFPGWSQLFSLLPGLTGVHLRHAFLRHSLRNCGDDACVSFGTVFSHSGASVGRSVYVGNYCSIGDVTLEDDVLIASHVSIMNGCRQHGTDRLDIPMREQPGEYPSITIGRDTWIGERATVAASVGRHCIIGAGSLVLSPVPDYGIAVGVPARVIRSRRPAATDPGLSDSPIAMPELIEC